MLCNKVTFIKKKKKLHGDQGTNFELKKFVEICKLTKLFHTIPLYPQSDGEVGHFNRTLVEMLHGMIKEHQKDWDFQLPACMMAYRGAESNGVSPNHFTSVEKWKVSQMSLPWHLLMHHHSRLTMPKLFKRDWPKHIIWLDGT